MSTKQALKKALKRKEPPRPILLRSGSTGLDLALSGTLNGAYPAGDFVSFVGDSSSGKTMLALTSLAEASINPDFDRYRLIFIDAEKGAKMNFTKFFGPKAAARIEVIDFAGKTIEDLYAYLEELNQAGIPFIAVVDSMDALTSVDEEKKFQEMRKAKDRSKVSGEMSDGKAKKNSKYLRRVVGLLAKSGSILLVLRQTRDNMGFGAQFNPKTASGGRALKFYAGAEVWTSIVGSLKKGVRGKQHKVGIICRCEVKKNRMSGNDTIIDVPILRHYGVDDIGSCIRYLTEYTGHWTKNSTTGAITAPEFDFKGKEAKLVQKIEDEGLEMDLKAIVLEAFLLLEEALKGKRKSRYV